VTFGGQLVERREGAQIQIVGTQILGGLAGGALHFRQQQLWLDGPGNATRYLVLKFENVIERAVEAVRPDVGRHSSYRSTAR